QLHQLHLAHEAQHRSWAFDQVPFVVALRRSQQNHASSSDFRLGVGDAHRLGNTGRTFLALELDGPLVCHANAAVWHVVGGEQLLAAADARTNLHGVGETHFVRAVVYAVPHIVDLEYIPAEGSDHGQGKITVCDGLAIRHVRLAALDINMDPLMVAACFGKCVDPFLCHYQPVAD